MFWLVENNKQLDTLKSYCKGDAFIEIIPYTDSNWNDDIEIINYRSDGLPIYGLPIFNPDYELIQDTPFTFSAYDDY